MATSSEVARAVSVAFGIPAETVQMHIRLLREAERIVVTGRGRSVSKLDLHHVSVTLISCLSTPVVKSGPIEAEAFGSLFSSDSWDVRYKSLDKTEMENIPSSNTFQSTYFINFLCSILSDLLMQIDCRSRDEDRHKYDVSPQSITLERAAFIDREKVERRAFARVMIDKSQHMSRFFHQSDGVLMNSQKSLAYDLPWIGDPKEPVIYSCQTIYGQSLLTLIRYLHSHSAI